MPRFTYLPGPEDPATTRTFGVDFAGEPAEVSEEAAVVLRGNPWFAEVAEPEASADANGDGVETVEELRAALDARGVAYDGRWGVVKLREALSAAGG